MGKAERRREGSNSGDAGQARSPPTRRAPSQRTLGRARAPRIPRAGERSGGGGATAVTIARMRTGPRRRRKGRTPARGATRRSARRRSRAPRSTGSARPRRPRTSRSRSRPGRAVDGREKRAILTTSPTLAGVSVFTSAPTPRLAVPRATEIRPPAAFRATRQAKTQLMKPAAKPSDGQSQPVPIGSPKRHERVRDPRTEHLRHGGGSDHGHQHESRNDRA